MISPLVPSSNEWLRDKKWSHMKEKFVYTEKNQPKIERANRKCGDFPSAGKTTVFNSEVKGSMGKCEEARYPRSCMV